MFINSEIRQLGFTRSNISSIAEDRGKNMYTKYYYAGITFGTALAITISFAENKSVLWAIIHGFLSWFYVIYYVLFI